MGITFQTQFSLKDLKKRKFDFQFLVDNQSYILEFDGMQHFQETPLFHKDYEEFKDKQIVDVLKSMHAILENHFIIRIDAKSTDKIEFHIQEALKLDKESKWYFSRPHIYNFIFDIVEEV